ncbi:hypothetical protein B0H13DRAFT_2318532 [Mycena leptocephala]|nr:hypothetical protein B0H13DRAFT_2318532 [Mycena leptocephala]
MRSMITTSRLPCLNLKGRDLFANWTRKEARHCAHAGTFCCSGSNAIWPSVSYFGNQHSALEELLSKILKVYVPCSLSKAIEVLKQIIHSTAYRTSSQSITSRYMSREQRRRLITTVILPRRVPKVVVPASPPREHRLSSSVKYLTIKMTLFKPFTRCVADNPGTVLLAAYRSLQSKDRAAKADFFPFGPNRCFNVQSTGRHLDLPGGPLARQWLFYPDRRWNSSLPSVPVRDEIHRRLCSVLRRVAAKLAEMRTEWARSRGIRYLFLALYGLRLRPPYRIVEGASVLLCVSLPTTNARASGEQFQAVSETSPSALTRDLAWDLLHTDIRFAIPSSSPPACTIKSSSPTPAVSPGHSCASSTAGAPANDPEDVESRDIRCTIPVVRPAIILLPPADISRSDFRAAYFRSEHGQVVHVIARTPLVVLLLATLDSDDAIVPLLTAFTDVPQLWLLAENTRTMRAIGTERPQSSSAINAATTLRHSTRPRGYGEMEGGAESKDFELLHVFLSIYMHVPVCMLTRPDAVVALSASMGRFSDSTLRREPLLTSDVPREPDSTPTIPFIAGKTLQTRSPSSITTSCSDGGESGPLQDDPKDGYSCAARWLVSKCSHAVYAPWTRIFGSCCICGWIALDADVEVVDVDPGEYLVSSQARAFVTDPAQKNVESCPSDNLVALFTNAGAPRSFSAFYLRGPILIFHPLRLIGYIVRTPLPASRAVLRTRFMLLLALFRAPCGSRTAAFVIPAAGYTIWELCPASAASSQSRCLSGLGDGMRRDVMWWAGRRAAAAEDDGCLTWSSNKTTTFRTDLTSICLVFLELYPKLEDESAYVMATFCWAPED